MKTVSRLLSLMAGFRRWVILAIILGWATTMSWVGLILTSSYLISYAALQPSIAELQVAIVGVRFFGLSRGIFRYIERLISHNVTFKLLTNLRVWFYESIEPIAPFGLLDFQRGDLLNRMMDDVEALQDFYVRVFGPVIVAILSSLSIFILFSQWSLQFAVALSFFHLIIGLVIPMATLNLSRRVSKQLVNMRVKRSILAIDIVQGSSEIIVYGQEDAFLKKSEELEKSKRRIEQRLNRIRAINSGIVSSLIQLTALVMLVIAVPLVNSGILDGKLLAVVLLGSIASFESIMSLPQAFQNLEVSLDAGKRILEVVEQESTAVHFDKSLELVKDPIFEFKNVSFSLNSTLILRDITFSFPKGKKIAIVGPSGSGKTTLINLLLGFWEYDQGNISMNHSDIRSINRDEIRLQIGYVAQEHYIFNATIAENIRIGNPKASNQDIEQAAQKAGLEDFISSLPLGFETIVGEEGAFLSGGQKQMISIARAFLRKVPFLIFDEPYSGLDRLSQALIHKMLIENSQNRGLLLVTHTFLTLSDMDEILVLDDGQIIERGTEQVLLNYGGTYRRMYDLQQDFIAGHLAP